MTNKKLKKLVEAATRKTENAYDYFYAAVGDTYASALDKGQKLSREELKEKAAALLRERWNIKQVDMNLLEKAIKDFKGESAQINEAYSLKDLNKELENDVKNLSFAAKHVQDRFKYRTLDNMSYQPADAEKIYLQIRKVIHSAATELTKLSTQVIG